MFVVSDVKIDVPLQSNHGEPIDREGSYHRYVKIDTGACANTEHGASHYEASHHDEVSINVRPPLEAKCPRCWRWTLDKSKKEDPQALCGRCEDVLKEKGIYRDAA